MSESKDASIYKVITADNFALSDSLGYIDDEYADQHSSFIHACDANLVDEIRKKFFTGEDVVVIHIDPVFAEKAGFKIVYEQNHPGGNYYWHFYRPRPNAKLPITCIISATHAHCRDR